MCWCRVLPFACQMLVLNAFSLFFSHSFTTDLKKNKGSYLWPHDTVFNVTELDTVDISNIKVLETLCGKGCYTNRLKSTLKIHHSQFIYCACF